MDGADLVGREVWIMETGVYTNASVAGIYASLEAALAAHPKGNWSERGEGEWMNDLDFDDFAMCYSTEVEGAPVPVVP